MLGTAVKTETRDIGPLSLRASVRPGSVDEKKRTIDIVWATAGVRVLRGCYDRFYEELSLNPAHVRMARLQSGQAPLLDQHNANERSASAIIGVVETAAVDGKQGTATVRFARAEDDPEADAIFRKVADGIIANVSVGYRVHKFEQIEISTDGSTPVLRAIDWEPVEISLVDIGEDPGAGVRSANTGTLMPCEFVTRRSEEAPVEKPAVEQPKNETPAPVVVPAPIPETVRATELEAATSAERTRAATITDLCTRQKLDDKFAAKLISDGTSLDKARSAILDELAIRSDKIKTEQHVRIEGGEDAQDKFIRGASAWLFERAGVQDLMQRAAKVDAKRFGDIALDGGEFRGLSLTELARECLERRGFKTRGMSRMEMVGAAFTNRSGGMAGTSDFAILFENVLGKTLLGAYATQADTWSRFCKADTVPDFRASNRYRTGSIGVLDSLNAHGEFESKAIPDGEKTAITVSTKGNIIALSRQAIINDDMSALADMAQKFGRAARNSIEADVYALLNANSGLGPTQTDGQPFFHANRKNVATGAALSASSLDADRVKMAQQRDVGSNEYLDLRPAVLLVQTANGSEAKVLNDAQFDPADSKFQKPNRVRGMVRDNVDSPRLTDADRRYIFADPGNAPAIVVAFLEGYGQAPRLETKDGWRVDGTEWKVVLDYKAQMFDWRGAVTNAGK